MLINSSINNLLHTLKWLKVLDKFVYEMWWLMTDSKIPNRIRKMLLFSRNYLKQVYGLRINHKRFM